MTTICKKRGAPRQSLANRIGRRRLRESGELYLIMLPVLVMIFIFFYMPMFGVVIAFQDYVPGDPFFAFDGSTKWAPYTIYRRSVYLDLCCLCYRSGHP